MWGYARVIGALAAGIFIAGFSALVSSPACREGMSSSASIVAVAKVEYPLGAAPVDELPPPMSMSKYLNLAGKGLAVRPSADRFLLYTPTTEIYIEVISPSQTSVPFRLFPQRMGSSGTVDKEAILYRLEIPNFSPDSLNHTTAPATITLIPTGI